MRGGGGGGSFPFQCNFPLFPRQTSYKTNMRGAETVFTLCFKKRRGWPICSWDDLFAVPFFEPWVCFHVALSYLLHFLSGFVNRSSRKASTPCSPQRSAVCLIAASLVLLLLLSVEFTSAQYTHTALCTQQLVPSHQQRSEGRRRFPVAAAATRGRGFLKNCIYQQNWNHVDLQLQSSLKLKRIFKKIKSENDFFPLPNSILLVAMDCPLATERRNYTTHFFFNN